MQLHGIDFTSAPRRKKAIVCATGVLDEQRLTCTRLTRWDAFEPFERFLAQPGPWVAAMDFPFGQPRRLVRELGWREDWPRYVGRVAEQNKQQFCDKLLDYCAGQPAGDKHHLRRTDALAKACSPMMLYGVPVGRMFFEGAPRLLRAGVSVLPCLPNGSDRIVVEGYPALVARSLAAAAGERSAPYKNDRTDAQSRRTMRAALLKQCRAASGLDAYGISLSVDAELSGELVDDATGDALDALFCLIQAAAFRRNPRLIPADADPVEGWIADPTLTKRSEHTATSADT